jgi:hypothetical protein
MSTLQGRAGYPLPLQVLGILLSGNHVELFVGLIKNKQDNDS